MMKMLSDMTPEELEAAFGELQAENANLRILYGNELVRCGNLQKQLVRLAAQIAAQEAESCASDTNQAT